MKIIITMQIIMILLITRMIILMIKIMMMTVKLIVRPWQADATEQAGDLRRWESETQFPFFSGPCTPALHYIGLHRSWIHQF